MCPDCEAMKETIQDLKRAQAKMIDPESVKRPVPVDWTVLRNRLMTLELALDNAEKRNKELASRLKYKEDELLTLRSGLVTLMEGVK